MGNVTKKTGKIHHPVDKSKGKKLHSPHFAAFGQADKDTQVSGTVSKQGTTGNEIQGLLVHLSPSKHYRDQNQNRNQMFWVLRFKIDGANPGDTFTVKLIDAADPSNPLHSVDVVLDSAYSPHPHKGAPAITYPTQYDDPIPLEFAAYGTAEPTGGDVSGTMSQCDTPPTDIEEIEAPTDWMLYCYIVNPANPPNSILTVTQKNLPPGTAGGLTFGTS